jgi:uncharacterized protein (DUF1778 family)
MQESSKTINLRVKPEIQHLIDLAAAFTGKSRTEFMLEASRQAAVDALLDRSLITVDTDVYEQFLTALTAPPMPNPSLQRLLNTRSPWE